MKKSIPFAIKQQLYTAIIKDFMFWKRSTSDEASAIIFDLTWKNPFHLHGAKRQVKGGWKGTCSVPDPQVWSHPQPQHLEARLQWFALSHKYHAAWPQKIIIIITNSFKVSLKKPAQTLWQNQWKSCINLTSVLNVSMHPMPRNPVARWQRLVVQVFQVANSGPVQFGDRSQMDTWRVPNGRCPKLGCADPTSTWLRYKNTWPNILRPDL